MTEKQSSRDHDRGRTADRFDGPVGRRTFIAASSAVTGAVLAGCTSNGTDGTDDPQTGGTTDGSGTDGGTETADNGNFRLLISDRPADIEDFDRLDVTLDYARIFDGGEDESEGEDGEEKDGDEREEDENEDDAKESDAEATEADSDEDDGDEDESENTGEKDESEDENEAEADAESESDDETEAQPDANGVERNRGFYILDLEGATVDLTDVIGDRAIPVFDGELSPGTYEKIELHVSAVEGIVDGERATVKVPSEKLQITHPIEIRADEPVDFVFDINVVKRGNGNDYNLKPVISESGVAGKDVAVEEVDGSRNRGGEDEDAAANDTSESDDDDPDEEDDADSDDSDANGTE